MTQCPNIKHNLSWTVDGQVRPCNNIVNFPGSTTVDEMRSRTEFLQLQQDDASPYCQRCWDKESLGMTSKRESDGAVHEVYRKLHPDYLKIDAAIGSVCNAACRICGPESSTLWQQQEQTYIKVTSAAELWTTAHDNKDRILQLDFGGGEPWLNDVEQQTALFDQLIATGRAKKIKLRYNTNGSVRPRALLEKFDQFRSVEITLSIDDIEQRFEYNRYPLKWTTVVDNIKLLQSMTESNPLIRLTVNYSVSVFTFMYADQFLTWARRNQLPNVNWNLVDNPRVYNIKSLPPTVKTQLDPTSLFYDLVAAEPMPDWYDTFMAMTHRLDQIRDQNFVLTFPELERLL